MPGPIQRGRAFVERILSDGVETVNTEAARIAGKQVDDFGERVFQHIFDSDDGLVLDVPIDEGETYLMRYLILDTDGNPLKLRINDDDGQYYEYRYTNTTEVEDATSIIPFEANSGGTANVGNIFFGSIDGRGAQFVGQTGTSHSGGTSTDRLEFGLYRPDSPTDANNLNIITEDDGNEIRDGFLRVYKEDGL